MVMMQIELGKQRNEFAKDRGDLRIRGRGEGGRRVRDAGGECRREAQLSRLFDSWEAGK